MQALVCHENTRKFTYEYLKALDCPRALTAYLLWENSEHVQLAELTFEPTHYDTYERARDSLAATKLLSKATFLQTGINLEEVAMTKWFEAETACKISNDNLVSLANKPDLAALLLSMQFKIGAILGDFTPDEFIDSCNFGPGSSTTIKRRVATHPTKFQFETGLTQKALDFISPWFKEAYPQWEVPFKVVVGGQVCTVPKNSKTDRTIMIEPGFNLWFQKGLGEMIRRRLKRVGIDLNSQKFNQQASKLASIFNDVATVDFSSASDMISSRLVEELFPPRWLTLLKTFRSEIAIVDGKTIKLEKFSSMGNGFTFELETLIFYCLAQVACDWTGQKGDRVTVFGDDVILPSLSYDMFADMSAAIGFKVNLSKSYHSGYYRESCGAHYWAGKCIKPFFLKGELDGEESILRCANRVREISSRRRDGGCDKSLRRSWVFLASLLGTDFPRVSAGYGDIGLIVNPDEPHIARIVTPEADTWEGVFVLAVTPVPVYKEMYHRGLLLFKLKTLGKSRDIVEYRMKNPLDISEAGSVGNEIPMPMGSINKLRPVYIPQWVDLGPWV